MKTFLFFLRTRADHRFIRVYAVKAIDTPDAQDKIKKENNAGILFWTVLEQEDVVRVCSIDTTVAFGN